MDIKIHTDHNGFRSIMDALDSQEALEAFVQEVRGVLEFYAGAPEGEDMDLSSWQEDMNEDGGDKARALLAKLTTKE